MALGRPKAELILTFEQQEQLNGMAASRSLPAGLVMRARIILMSVEGQSNLAIATRLRLFQTTVGQWRRRFLEQGITGLHEELRPGRPRAIGDERVARLVRKTLESKPKTERIGVSGRSQKRHACRNRRCNASGRRLDWSRTDRNISSSRPIHFL